MIYQLAIVAALLSLAFFFTVRVVAERAAEGTQDNLLTASATSIAEAVYIERQNIGLELPYAALSMLGTVSDERVFYRVLVDDETLTGYEGLPLPEDGPKLGSAAFSTVIFSDEKVRLAAVLRSLSIGNQSREVMVVVGQTQSGLAEISSRITTTATAFGIAFFLIATALSAIAARSALAPIDRLAVSVGRRGPNDLRPVTAETPLELKPLVAGLNNFMERLSGALDRSEDLITEAAHRVRTPLATVRTQAEVIHRNMRQDKNRTAVREMIRAIDESSRSAGQLLDHAMVTLRSEQISPQEVDLSALVRDTVDRLTPTAELKDIQIVLELPDQKLTTQGDTILLQNALRNILDNAIKYSPGETDILVTANASNPCKIRILDQGRGFGFLGEVDLTKRFSRGSNVTDIVGSGLGLTIAKDVARAHGGELQTDNNPEGVGACVTLVLPLSSF